MDVRQHTCSGCPMRTCLRDPGKGPGMVSDGALRLELDVVQQRGRELGLGIPGWGTIQAGREEW